MPDHADPDLVRALKALRRGRGLTQASVTKSAVVLRALGNPSPAEAVRRICESVRALGDDVPAHALRTAYAIDMSSPGTLTDRRETFALTQRMHSDTIEKYENQMIQELAIRLRHSTDVPGAVTLVPYPEKVEVGASVEDGQLQQLVIQEYVDETSQPYVQVYENEHGEGFFDYIVPDRPPRSVALRVDFSGVLPEKVWCSLYRNIYEFAVGLPIMIKRPTDSKGGSAGCEFASFYFSDDCEPRQILVVGWEPSEHLR